MDIRPFKGDFSLWEVFLTVHVVIPWLFLSVSNCHRLVVGHQTAEQEVAGLNPSWTTNQVPKITGKIMLAVHLQTCLSSDDCIIGGDLKLWALSPTPLHVHVHTKGAFFWGYFVILIPV